MLAITDASAGADSLGYVISVTNDVVTVRSEPDGAGRDYNTDYNTAFLQPYVGKVSNSARQHAPPARRQRWGGGDDRITSQGALAKREQQVLLWPC